MMIGLVRRSLVFCMPKRFLMTSRPIACLISLLLYSYRLCFTVYRVPPMYHPLRYLSCQHHFPRSSLALFCKHCTIAAPPDVVAPCDGECPFFLNPGTYSLTSAL